MAIAKGDPFGPAAFSQTWGGSGSYPAPDKEDGLSPDTPTAESEDWRTQGDGRILMTDWTPADYERALAQLRARISTPFNRLRARLDKIAKADEPGVKQIDFQGMPIEVDRPRGFVQEGQRPDGSMWQRIYQYDYGYLPGTEGGDGDGVDVYVGPDEQAEQAYWIEQTDFGDPPAFDEWKVFVGFPSPARAELAFRLHSPAQILGRTFAVPIGVMHSLVGRDPRTGAGEEILGAMRKVDQRSETSDFSEGGLYGAPYPMPDVVNDQPRSQPSSVSVPDILERTRARLDAMARRGSPSSEHDMDGAPGPPEAVDMARKAGEGGEGSADAVGEGARSVAERIGELGEGGGKKPEGHGGGGHGGDEHRDDHGRFA